MEKRGQGSKDSKVHKPVESKKEKPQGAETGSAKKPQSLWYARGLGQPFEKPDKETGQDVELELFKEIIALTYSDFESGKTGNSIEDFKAAKAHFEKPISDPVIYKKREALIIKLRTETQKSTFKKQGELVPDGQQETPKIGLAALFKRAEEIVATSRTAGRPPKDGSYTPKVNVHFLTSAENVQFLKAMGPRYQTRLHAFVTAIREEAEAETLESESEPS